MLPQFQSVCAIPTILPQRKPVTHVKRNRPYFKILPLSKSPPLSFHTSEFKFHVTDIHSQAVLEGGSGANWGTCEVETQIINVILSFETL